MTERSTGGKRPPRRRPPAKHPEAVAAQPQQPPDDVVRLTSPQGTRATVPADLADKMRRQGWT